MTSPSFGVVRNIPSFSTTERWSLMSCESTDFFTFVRRRRSLVYGRTCHQIPVHVPVMPCACVYLQLRVSIFS